MRIQVPAAIAALALSATGALSAPVTLIDSTAWGAAGCIGAASCVIGEATVSAAPQPGATLIETNFRGLAGLGVNFNLNAGAGNPLEPEISGPAAGGGTEKIVIDFKRGQLIDSVVIGHLFSTETFANDPDEEAVIEATGVKGFGTFKLKNVDNTMGIFTVTNPGFASSVVHVDEFTGQFAISNLFASLGPITQLVFSATALQGPSVAGLPGTRGDYSIALVSTTAVPLPAAAWLLLGAMGGLGVLSRRRSRAA